MAREMAIVFIKDGKRVECGVITELTTKDKKGDFYFARTDEGYLFECANGVFKLSKAGEVFFESRLAPPEMVLISGLSINNLYFPNDMEVIIYDKADAMQNGVGTLR